MAKQTTFLSEDKIACYFNDEWFQRYLRLHPEESQRMTQMIGTDEYPLLVERCMRLSLGYLDRMKKRNRFQGGKLLSFEDYTRKWNPFENVFDAFPETDALQSKTAQEKIIYYEQKIAEIDQKIEQSQFEKGQLEVKRKILENEIFNLKSKMKYYLQTKKDAVSPHFPLLLGGTFIGSVATIFLLITAFTSPYTVLSIFSGALDFLSFVGTLILGKATYTLGKKKVNAKKYLGTFSDEYEIKLQEGIEKNQKKLVQLSNREMEWFKAHRRYAWGRNLYVIRKSQVYVSNRVNLSASENTKENEDKPFQKVLVQK